MRNFVFHQINVAANQQQHACDKLGIIDRCMNIITLEGYFDLCIVNAETKLRTTLYLEWKVLLKHINFTNISRAETSNPFQTNHVRGHSQITFLQFFDQPNLFSTFTKQSLLTKLAFG